LLWCVLEGGVAAGLLLAGGLKAIQMASIAAGLPIAILMMVMSYTLIRSLRAETFSDLPHLPPARLPIHEHAREAFSQHGGPLPDGSGESLLTARKAS
jgi:choline/glycine/proline betaine transport protein